MASEQFHLHALEDAVAIAEAIAATAADDELRGAARDAACYVNVLLDKLRAIDE